MVQEAEANKEADKKFEDLVVARNQAEQLIHATRKQLEEVGSSLAADDKHQIETAISELENACALDNKEAIDSKTQALATAVKTLTEHTQQQAQSNANDAQSNVDDDVVEADFEEMK